MHSTIAHSLMAPAPQVSSPTLESLLTILDARHYYGDYQPAMGLRAAMERLQGANSQLREQVRAARQEEERAAAAGSRLRARLATAEAELKAIRGGGGAPGYGGAPAPAPAVVLAAPTLPTQLPSSAAETVARLETQLLQLLDERAVGEAAGRKREAEVAALGGKLGAARHQLGLLYAEHGRRAEEWRGERARLEGQVAEREDRLAGAAERQEEQEAQLASLEGEGEAGRRQAETARRIALLRANEAVMGRRYKVQL
jgi:chromosome segregation ATPase